MFRIKHASCYDRTPSSGSVGKIDMIIGCGSRALVSGDGGENTVRKVPLQTGVVLAQAREVRAITPICLRCIVREPAAAESRRTLDMRIGVEHLKGAVDFLATCPENRRMLDAHRMSM